MNISINTPSGKSVVSFSVKVNTGDLPVCVYIPGQLCNFICKVQQSKPLQVGESSLSWRIISSFLYSMTLLTEQLWNTVGTSSEKLSFVVIIKQDNGFSGSSRDSNPAIYSTVHIYASSLLRRLDLLK